jgi:hypothetical protein
MDKANLSFSDTDRIQPRHLGHRAVDLDGPFTVRNRLWFFILLHNFLLVWTNGTRGFSMGDMMLVFFGLLNLGGRVDTIVLASSVGITA